MDGISKESGQFTCPLDKVRELHEQVKACWRRYQALSLELLALEGRVADCRKELTATAQAIYELRQRSRIDEP